MHTLTAEQAAILKRAGLEISPVAFEKLTDTAQVWTFSEEDAVLSCKILNALYRVGRPIVADIDYDQVFRARLSELNPEHPYLHSVEPEPVDEDELVRLPKPMLSTKKVYGETEIEQWLGRIVKAAGQVNIPVGDIKIRLTPKLDGFAAYDDGEHLYSRGDGLRGRLYTYVLERGLQVALGGQRGLGAGEVVVDKHFFAEHLSQRFENTRNVIGSVMAPVNENALAVKAIEDGAVVFFPFALLPGLNVTIDDVRTDLKSLRDQVLGGCIYDVDGLILEVANEEIKAVMGAASDHHRWQVAFKENSDGKITRVLDVSPQTGRTGQVTPVAKLEPVRLVNVSVSRATLHHYGKVKNEGVGKGAEVLVVRGGDVIPNIETIITPAKAIIPDCCPSCGSGLEWEGDFLFCRNMAGCPAQVETSLQHFFSTLGTAKGFGSVVVAKLAQAGVREPYDVYQMDLQQFNDCGITGKTAQNLIDQLNRSIRYETEDWRFLAAFGLRELSVGMAERLLKHYTINELFELTAAQLIQIPDVGKITAPLFEKELKVARSKIERVLSLGFKLTATKGAAQSAGSTIAGKNVVFTGTMISMSRDEIKAIAKRLGANVQSSVSGKTDMLITGENVGANKTAGAAANGTQVIPEAEFLKMIGYQ